MKRVLLIMLLLMPTAAPALAQGDPTPTSPFVTPTPWARATPTPWAVEDGIDHAAELAFSADDTGQFADTIINAYNFLNQSGVISTIIFFMMSMMVLGLLMKVIRRSKAV